MDMDVFMGFQENWYIVTGYMIKQILLKAVTRLKGVLKKWKRMMVIYIYIYIYIEKYINIYKTIIPFQNLTCQTKM